MSEIYTAVKALSDRLASIQGIAKVYTEWPRPDQRLTLPSISITTANARIENRIPSVASANDNADGVTIDEVMYTGEYMLDLQIDVWTEYKAQREDFYRKILLEFESEVFGDGTPSLKIKLAEYFNSWAAYYLKGYRYHDGPEPSLSGEWRMAMEVDAAFPVLISRNRPKITHSAIMEEDIN